MSRTYKPDWEPYMKRYKRFRELNKRERNQFIKEALESSEEALKSASGKFKADLIEEDLRDEQQI